MKTAAQTRAIVEAAQARSENARCQLCGKASSWTQHASASSGLHVLVRANGTTDTDAFNVDGNAGNIPSLPVVVLSCQTPGCRALQLVRADDAL